MGTPVSQVLTAAGDSAIAFVKPRLRGYLHLVAAILSVGSLVWLVRVASSTPARVAAWVYGLAAVLCYLTSSTYHVFTRTGRLRRAFQRADHSMIYVLIAGTFTPIALLAVGGTIGWIVIGLIWACALFGVITWVLPRPRLPRFGFALYLIMGWAGIGLVPALADNPTHIVLVAAAGILYTVGAILFALHRPRLSPTWFGYHELWHALGITAGALLFIVNFNLIATPAT